VGESTDYELNDKEKSTKSELGKSTKSEPPSIYKEKEEKENIYTPYINSGIATDAQIMPIVNALKGVAKERYTNGRHQKFDDVALTIFHDGATPEDVTKFGEWWKRNCWYDPPTPASLLTIADEWQNFVNGVERPSPNGNGHNQDPNLVEFAVFPEGF
jgi:hypothetical protein